jgi:hypothetical protein
MQNVNKRHMDAAAAAAVSAISVDTGLSASAGATIDNALVLSRSR